MSVEINVSKKSIKEFLSNGKNNRIVIPEYQRLYSWKCEQADTLFEDIREFMISINNDESKKNETYFLGSIVFYENSYGQYEIIDGQQRITSLFLLLRSIHKKLTKLSNENPSKAVNHYIGIITPLIWNTSEHTGEPIYDDALISSKIINDDGTTNSPLKKILQTGEIEEGACDNYSQNYKRFCQLIDKFDDDNEKMYDFFKVLLNQVILLPISAGSQETALTIFSTLNDRGLPLSDADIFKAKIYNNLDESKRREFIERWKKLEEYSEGNKLGTKKIGSMENLFTHYMFYLKAKHSDKNTTAISLRSYYSKDKFSKLFEENIVDELENILNILNILKNYYDIDDVSFLNNEIKKTLDMLNSYEMEWWKYSAVIFYLKHKDNHNFERRFELFLRNLLLEILTKYLMYSSNSSTFGYDIIKGDILKLNISIMDTIKPEFNFTVGGVGIAEIPSKIGKLRRKLEIIILKLLVYEKQNELLPKNNKIEVEHIFPKAYDEKYLLEDTRENIEKKLEYIGNKLLVEKNLNKEASNRCFDDKKKIYSKSNIRLVREFSISYVKWDLIDIDDRNDYIVDKIKKIKERWNREYEIL